MRYFNQVRIICATAALIFAMILSVSAAWAQARTTPVEVKNAPSVSVTNSPTVKVDPAANTVQAQQNGAWNVGVVGTPSVSVSNSPTVKIDNAFNNVVTTAKIGSYLPLTSNLIVPPGQELLMGQPFSCAGYKELRFVFYSDSLSATANLKIKVYFHAPNQPAGYYCVGTVNFGTPTHSICEQANFTQVPYACMFNMPALGDSCALYVYNGNASSATIYYSSWVYMVS